MNEKIRLQKHIANSGICSRRKAEELIEAGNVSVNDKIIREMGVKIDPTKDKVKINGKKVTNETEQSFGYILMNKPVGIITSTSNKQGVSVNDLLVPENRLGKSFDKKMHRVYPVGRLDKDSEGLVLLTNDGALTNTLTHPRNSHEKEYEVTIDKPLSKEARNVLEKGMFLGNDETVRGIKIIKSTKIGKFSVVSVILKEGKNRQIRRMFGRLGYKVTKLKRVRLGKLRLGTLPIGKWKFVPKNSIV